MKDLLKIARQLSLALVTYSLALALMGQALSIEQTSSTCSARFDDCTNPVFSIDWGKGIGFPFFISGIVGLLTLVLLLVFVEERQRKDKRKKEVETLDASLLD